MNQIFADSLRTFRRTLRALGVSKKGSGFLMPNLYHPTGDWRSVPNQSAWVDVEVWIGDVHILAHVRAR